MTERELLRVENLKKYFTARTGGGKKLVKAVDDVSFSINRGETLGLVGESGSGKTTLGRTLLRLVEPDSGKIIYRGEDITHANMRPYRSKMQISFQNPAGSLDPRMRVRDVIGEGLRAAGVRDKHEVDEAVAALLQKVGLQETDMYRYPGEFSGGQQQRIGIARALAVNPEFIVCDEPVSALDVSYQSQIINLLEDLQEQLGLTYLFISHDLSVVMHISDRVGVMYLGKLVEIGSREDIVLRPTHPYTKSLLSAIPLPDPKRSRARERVAIVGDLGGAVPESGCRFCPRCPNARPECAQLASELTELSPGHLCACPVAAQTAEA